MCSHSMVSAHILDCMFANQLFQDVHSKVNCVAMRIMLLSALAGIC